MGQWTSPVQSVVTPNLVKSAGSRGGIAARLLRLRFQRTHQDPSEHGSGHDAGGNADHDTPNDGAAEVCVILRGGQHGCGMRRDGAVHDGEPRQHGKANENRRTAAAPRRGRDDGHHQHQAHLEKHGHADQDAEAEKRPGQASFRRIFRRVCCPVRLRRRNWQEGGRESRRGPSTMAMWPIRPPTPAVNETGTCDSGMPAAMPRAKADTASARAGCRRTRAIRTSSSRTVPAAQASRNQLEGRRPARGTHGLFHIRASGQEFCSVR